MTIRLVNRPKNINTVKPVYLKHVDKWFLETYLLNNIDLILKTSYLRVEGRQVLLK